MTPKLTVDLSVEESEIGLVEALYRYNRLIFQGLWTLSSKGKDAQLLLSTASAIEESLARFVLWGETVPSGRSVGRRTRAFFGS